MAAGITCPDMAGIRDIDFMTLTKTPAQSSRQIPVALPAATASGIGAGGLIPGEIQLANAGNTFYVIVTSSPVTLQGVRAGAITASNVYGNGQGQTVEGGFDTVKVANFNPFPVVALIWVGFDTFINNQLILANTLIQNVLNPAYPVANALATVQIPDLSGQQFFDINGKKWGAIQRVAVLLFNVDTGVTYNIQKRQAVGSASDGPSVGVVYPSTPIRIDAAGDFTIYAGGGAINMIISEIYQAIAA